ncbi:MAG: hypothetical protein LBD47_08995 [Treponema sp.]|nr:hypothetical protein [Treponema sp.]
MKNLARLVLFFSLGFAVLFLAAAGLRYLAIRVDWVRTLPRRQGTMLTDLIAAARWALSLALYASLLLSLSYAARGRFSVPVTAACLVALPLAFSYGVSLGLARMENLPPVRDTAKVLGGPGLFLTNARRSSDTSIVLLEGPARPGGARVAAIPGRPLIYQSEAAGPGTASSLPPIPFRDDVPWFLQSMSIDIRLSAEQLEARFKAGPLPFLIYAGALILLLSSLRFILTVSAWPLANLFLGCLVFRGILALETFFNSSETQDVFESFLENRLPLSLSVPLIFCAFGVLVHIYSLLVYAAKWRRDNED